MVYKSIKEDMNDDHAFRHPINKYEGYVMNKEYNEFCPHFFTADRASVVLEGLYKNMSIFLICNGPSFASLNHDLLRQPGVMTFGINNGARTFRPNFWTCVDDPVRFIKSIWLDPKITKFIPQTHFDKPIFDNEKWIVMNKKVRECPNVLGYMRNEHFQAETFLKESSLNWGNHKNFGGGRSVMLPALRILYLLGFRTVYLLGCDMKMSETYTYHFDEQRHKGAVNCNMGTYDRLKNDYLPQLKPYFDNAGFQVYNCNFESELKCFPFISFSDAIEKTIKDLGDIENERTFGMYSGTDEKTEWRTDLSKEKKEHLKTLEQIKKGEVVNIEIPNKFKKKNAINNVNLQQTQKQSASMPNVTETIKHTPMPKRMPIVDVSPKKVLPSVPVPHPIETKVINNDKQQNINIDAKTLNVIDTKEHIKSPTPPIINITPKKNINIQKFNLNDDKIII